MSLQSLFRTSLLVLLAVAPAAARADVVQPPPTFCPPGKVGRTSHAGPECVKKAPTDCPPGWRGIEGGTCMLMPCASDAECPADHACVEHLACLQPFSDDTYDPGEDERESRGAGLPPPDLLAGPPPMRKPRPTPIIRYDAVNLCSAEIACAAPRTCQPEKLCAPRGARALAYRGDNVSPARVARKTPSLPAPAPVSSAAPGEPAKPLESTAPMRGSCAGCAEAGGASGGGLGALGAAGVLLWRRRRRSARVSREDASS